MFFCFMVMRFVVPIATLYGKVFFQFMRIDKIGCVVVMVTLCVKYLFQSMTIDTMVFCLVQLMFQYSLHHIYGHFFQLSMALMKMKCICFKRYYDICLITI